MFILNLPASISGRQENKGQAVLKHVLLGGFHSYWKQAVIKVQADAILEVDRVQAHTHISGEAGRLCMYMYECVYVAKSTERKRN